MILFWTPGGMPLLLHIEGVIAKALMHRGQDVHAVLCDGSYRACILREIQQNIPISKWSESCIGCIKNTSQTLDKMGIPYSYIGDFVSVQAREYLWRKTETVTWDDLEGLQYEGVPIGKNIQSAIIRYLQGCPLIGNEDIVREYVYSAYLCAEAAKNAYAKLKVDKIVMSHGVYAEWGPALQTAWNLRIPVIAWMGSYLRCRFYFRQIEDNIRLDFHNMSREAWNACRQMDFSAEKEARLHQYQVDRYQKHISFDMKRFKEYSGQTEHLRKKYAPLPDKPVWGIMAHINWDTVSDYSPMAYPSFDDWIKDTIQEISNITNVQWLVKVHPAESWDNPASGVQKLLEHNFPRLPAHIKVISAEEQISPLDFFNMIDGGITVYGTGGLELALQGKPVILAGESHYGGKGFTYDGLTTESYKQLLHKAWTLPRLNADQLLLTKKYAYCYFIQRQIPVPVVMDPTTDWWCFQEQQAHLLLPGKDPFIDFLCDRIFDGQDFIMPESLVLLAENVYDPESDVNNQPIDETNLKVQNEIARLIEQVSVSIGAKDLSSAYTQILKFLADYSVNLDAAVRSDLQNSAVLLKANLDKIVPPDTAPHEVSPINMKPILGFDPAGEVFTHNGRVYRGVFTGHGRQARAVYDLCLNRNLFAAGVVNTTLVNFAPFNQMGYDLVLEHERVPFISYAHEWTPSMLKDAALFQIDLDLQLLDSDLILKDCGATTNVLFDAAKPVYVDFLSIVPVDKLTGEEWLAPDQTARQQYAGLSQKCQYFNEIFKRMFFPGILLPLYITHQNKAETARKCLLQTALNTTGDTVTELETFADAPYHLHFAYQKYRALQESALRNEDVKQYLLIQRHEIEEMDVSTSQSDYADYYESKGEGFDLFPNNAWKPKQWGVFNALQSLKPATVLDIGANTGWFSILATKHGAKVISLDNDVACMDILYRRAKQENLSILPLIVDFLDPTPDVSAMAELCREPHFLNSRFATDIPLLLSADKRIACDMVIALAIIHHLCLGGGRHLDDVTKQLALFAKKHLVLEFVIKEDPLIVGEPDFFKAQYANPTDFDWYSLETCLELLGRFFESIQQIPLTSTRILLVCTDKIEGALNLQSHTATCDDCSTFTTNMDKGNGVAVGRLPMVTVIIPSYNRANMIGITLESFVNQDYPKNRYEIIVADNNSTDSTKAVVLQWQAKSTVPIKYIFEPRQGVHYARNSAAKQANGEILYFTDDDMIAESDLLSELVKVFKIDPLVGSATGRVLPKWEAEPPEWILSLCNNFYLSLNDLGEETIIAEHDIGVFSCHQAMTRDAFFKAGGFNPESTYTDYIGDGETGLNIKLKDLGYKFGYNGKSVIHHMIPPSRMTQDYLNKRLANQGSADCYTEYKKHRFSSEQLADRVQGYVNHMIERSSLCADKRLNGDVSWRLDKAKTHYYLNRIEYDIRLMKDPAWRELVLRDDWINE